MNVQQITVPQTQLSLEEAINKRKKYDSKIDEEMGKLNTSFQKDPNNTDTHRLVKLITKRNNVNDRIVTIINKNQAPPRDNFYEKTGISKVTLFTGTVCFFAWLCTAGPGIAGIITGVNATTAITASAVSSIAQTVFSVVGLPLTAGVCSVVQSIDNDRYQYQSLAGITRLEEKGEANLAECLKLFNESKESQKQQNEALKNQMKEFMQKFDKIPEESRQKLPPREDWMLNWIDKLSDDDPLKIQIVSLLETAKRLAEIAQNKEPENSQLQIQQQEKTNSSQALRKRIKKEISKTPVKNNIIVEIDHVSESSSSSESFVAKNLQAGERLSLGSVIKLGNLTNSIEKDPSPRDNIELYQELYRAQWSKIEKEAGFEFKTLKLANTYFNEDGLLTVPTFERPIALSNVTREGNEIHISI